MNTGPGRPFLLSAGSTIFSAECKVGVGGLPLIRVCAKGRPDHFWDRSDRPLIKYDRTDHHLSSETPVEVYAGILEQEWSPRPILKLIGPINFFAERRVGVGG